MVGISHHNPSPPPLPSCSGAVYSGEWQKGLKHGRGEFVFQNGEVFEGAFHCDRMAGRVLGGEEGAGLMRPKTPLGSLIGQLCVRLINNNESLSSEFNEHPIALLRIHRSDLCKIV